MNIDMIVFAKDKIKSLLEYKIIRYGFLGGIATSIHFSVASLFLYFINNSVVQSNISGFLIAYIFSYLMQSKFVFKHNINIKKAAKYFIVQFASLLLAILLSGFFEGFSSYLRTLVIVIFLPLITFIVHKFWTFKETV